MNFKEILIFKNAGERAFVNKNNIYLSFMDVNTKTKNPITQVSLIKNGKLFKTIKQKFPFQSMSFIGNELIAVDNAGDCYKYDSDLNSYEELNLIFKGKHKNIFFGSTRKNDKKQFVSYNFKDSTFQWIKDQTYYGCSVCVGKKYLYTRIGGTYADNLPPTIQALDFETGRVVWELKFSPDKYSAASTIMIGVYKEHLYVYGTVTRDLIKISVHSGESVQKFKALYKPTLYKNKLVIFGSTPTYDLWELNLDADEVSIWKLENELALFNNQEVSVMPLNCASGGLVFGGIYQDVPSEHNNFKVLALDLETKKIAATMDLPDKGIMQTFRQAEFVNELFYFLDGDQTLRIFKKET